MIRTILKPLSFIPAIFLIYMIFSFSSQEGELSSQVSYKVSYKIIEAADYIFDANLDEWQKDEWANKIHFITRKLGHMTEYFALAVAVAFPLYVYGLHGILLMLVAGFICVGVACADEYYQSFVAGRTAAVKDVVIDSIGVFLGIIVVRIVGWTGRKTIFRPKKHKPKKRKKQQYNDYYDDYDNYAAPPENYQNGYGYNPPPRNYQNGYGYNPPPRNYQGGYNPPPANYQNGYNAPPRNYQPNAPYSPEINQDESFIVEPDYSDEWDVDVSDVFGTNSNYVPRPNSPEREDLASDWGQNDSQAPNVPPPYNNQEPFYQEPPYQEPPYQEPPKHPAPKKKSKKDKDWFFDM